MYETAFGTTASNFVKIIWCSRWFCIPLSFEAACCFICCRRRVTVARYRIICLVLDAILQSSLSLICVVCNRSCKLYGIQYSTPPPPHTHTHILTNDTATNAYLDSRCWQQATPIMMIRRSTPPPHDKPINAYLDSRCWQQATPIMMIRRSTPPPHDTPIINARLFEPCSPVDFSAPVSNELMFKNLL